MQLSRAEQKGFSCDSCTTEGGSTRLTRRRAEPASKQTSSAKHCADGRSWNFGTTAGTALLRRTVMEFPLEVSKCFAPFRSEGRAAPAELGQASSGRSA